MVNHHTFRLTRLLRLLLKSGSNKPGFGKPVPELHLHQADARFDPQHLSRYCEFFGFDKTLFPLPYLFVHAFELQLELFADPQFPLRALGLVHKEVRFYQHHELKPEGCYSVDIKIIDVTALAHGTEFEVQVHYRQHSTLVAGFDSRYFSPDGHQPRKVAVNTESDTAQPLKRLTLTPQQARQYARLSGDYNPIHLHALLARLFGFKRPIAHGLCLVSTFAAQGKLSQGKLSQGNLSPRRFAARFRRPALLPCELEMVMQTGQGRFNNAQGKPVVEFSWQE